MTTPVHAPTTPDELAEHRFFELSIDMLCFARFDGYFQHLNPAWERTLGHTITELQSQPMIEFVHPDDRERTLAQGAFGGGVEAITGNRRCPAASRAP